MRHALIFAGFLATLSGCSTADTESTETIVIDGRETELRVRTIVENGQPQQIFAVRAANGSFNTCDPSARGSCEKAARTSGGKGR